MAALAAIRSKDMTVEELTSLFLSKIESENPAIHAVRQVLADEAIQSARDMDDRLSRNETVGLLAGLPVLIKENCDTLGAVCSAGLNFRRTHKPRSDSWITARLRKAGAIVLGVSVSDPGAFDVRTLDVTHPLNPDLTVGGSSGGSAAALAAGMCLGTIGTDTGGSIRIPSACCATIGLKPTFGSLPMDGIFPLVPSLDHVGPMAGSVEDVRLIWSELATQSSLAQQPVKTVGINRKWIDVAAPEIRQAFAALQDMLADLNIKCVEIDMPDPAAIVDMHLRIFVVESAAYHLARFSNHLLSYPKIAQDGFEAAHPMPIAEYINAYKQRILFTKQVDALLSQVDCLITPTLAYFEPPRAAEKLLIDGVLVNFTAALVRHTCLFNHTGHPALAMPFPKAKSQLASMQIVCRHHQEEALLSFGSFLENPKRDF